MRTAVEPEARATGATHEADLRPSLPTPQAAITPQVSLPYHPVHSLQRSLGNQITRRALTAGMLQPKLRVGAPDDIYEKEADEVADQVMSLQRSFSAAGVSGSDDDKNNDLGNHPRNLARKASRQRSAHLSMLRRIPIRRLQQTLGNRALERLLRQTFPAQGVAENGADGYVEEAEEFTADDGGEPDVDLPARYVGDSTGQDASVQPNTMAAAPALNFLDLGRVGTARYGDPRNPGHHLIPHAFTDGGRTASVVWAGGGGAGAHGNQNAGSLQTNIAPTFFQTSPTADAWIREGTGRIDVIRSWTGVNAGDQGNGFFLTAAAAARINSHETLHVANSQGHYNADIDPLLDRVFGKTMDVVLANSLLPSAAPRSIPALKAIIQWPASVTRFQNGDMADNNAMGTVDTADLATGTYPIDAGPGTVAGKAFNHRVRTPGEANPAP